MPQENKIEEVKVVAYQPSTEVKKIIAETQRDFATADENRNFPYKEFGDRTIVDYINKSDEIYNALQKKISFEGRELSDLQSNIPRNKISAINSKIALSIPEPEIVAWGEDGVIDESGTKVLSGLNKWSEENKNARILHIKKGNELFTHGTVCTFTDFEAIYRTVKDVTKMDAFNPTFTKKKILDKYGVFTRVVPLQEIYLCSMYINDIQEQPYIFWKRTFNEYSFKASFNESNYYKDTDKVLAGISYTIGIDADYSVEQQENTTKQVTVIKKFDKQNDRIITLANGVLIQDIPFPWFHKKYPFGWIIADFFSNVDFAYGMSMPHKLSWDVESIEFLTNTLFEQAKVNVNPPMVNYGLTDFEDDVLYAGRVIKSEGQKGDLEVIKYPPLDQSVFQLMSLFQGNAERASVDDLSQGVSSGGQGITARRDVMAQQNAKETLSISFAMLLDLQRQESWIQVPLIIQFYTQKVSETIIGEDGAEKVTEFYKNFKVLDVEIDKITTTGKISGRAKGVMEVDIADEEKDVVGLDMKEDRARAAGLQLEVLSPSAQAIRNLKYTIRIPYPDNWTSSMDMKFNKLVTTMGVAMQFAPEIVDKANAVRELFKLSVENPDKMLLSEADMKQQAMQRDTQGSNSPAGVEQQMRQPQQVGMNNFGG